MWGVIVVDAGGSRSTNLGRGAYIHDHCLRYHHNYALFYQLLNSNLFTHRMLSLREKPLVKPMPPWYVSNVSTFSHAFPLVLDSNLHDLNGTNPGLTLFSVELSWCCFCAEIKVLGMERNFASNFYIIYKNFWSQDLAESGPWVGTTHQGAPLSWRA